MQPLDLSCPKNHLTSDDEIINDNHHNHLIRPRSSSGGSEESSPEFETRPRDLVKAAVLLNKCWPQAALSPVLALDGPARKRFLTKYLHKHGKKFYLANF